MNSPVMWASHWRVSKAAIVWFMMPRMSSALGVLALLAWGAAAVGVLGDGGVLIDSVGAGCGVLEGDGWFWQAMSKMVSRIRIEMCFICCVTFRYES